MAVQEFVPKCDVMRSNKNEHMWFNKAQKSGKIPTKKLQKIRITGRPRTLQKTET